MGVNADEPRTAAQSDQDWMRRALALARRAESLGEVPIGALIVQDGVLTAEGWNAPITDCDPTAHAEIVALRRAGRALGNYRLVGCTLYVTLEPCVMCLGAMVHARIGQLVFGAFDPQRGAVCSRIPLADADFFNHRLPYRGGILAEDCSELLRNFFLRRRGRGAAPTDVDRTTASS